MSEPQRTAFLFAGQGQQYVGMAGALCDRFDVARRTLAEADEALSAPLSTLIRRGPADALTLTANAQPALVAVSVAYHRVLAEHGVRPQVVAGHSLGEYSALVAAGALAFADAIRVVRRRGEAMQGAMPAGAGGMLALIGADPSVAEEVCRRATAGGGRVEVAADNCPGNIVVSGDAEALRRAEGIARGLGCHDVVPLAVSAPFHSSLLVPAAGALRDALVDVEIRPPEVEFIANVTATPVNDPGHIRSNLIRQVFMPLAWRRSLIWILESSAEAVQVGPGRALLGHVKRLRRRFPVRAVDEAQDLDALLCGAGGRAG